MTPSFPWRRIAAASLLALAGAAQAAIVQGSDVGLFRTFVDTTTGTVWADLDNHLQFTGSGFTHRFTDFSDYANALQAAGFSWATTGEVQAFMATNPLATAAGYLDLGAAMGSLSFGETGTLAGYADDGAGQATRQYGVPDYGGGTAAWASAPATAMPVALNDAGLWAYIAGPGGGGSVPLPGTLALAGLGLATMVASRRAKP